MAEEPAAALAAGADITLVTLVAVALVDVVDTVAVAATCADRFLLDGMLGVDGNAGLRPPETRVCLAVSVPGLLTGVDGGAVLPRSTESENKWPLATAGNSRSRDASALLSLLGRGTRGS